MNCLDYHNNNLALQLYFNGSSTCYLEEVMIVPKNLLLRNRGGCTCIPLHLPAGAHGYHVDVARLLREWTSTATPPSTVQLKTQSD